MPRSFLADIVLGLHIVVIFWAILGTAAAFFVHWYAVVNILLILAMVLSQRIFGVCPFTGLELKLRDEKGQYAGGCIVHYFNKWFGFRLPKWGVGVGEGVLFVAALLALFINKL